MSTPIIVAFQGEAGAYSEQGVRQHFGEEVEPLPCHDFAGIFQAINTGQAQHGVLPIENSLAGTVIPAYDELLEHDLRIQGETIVRVRHCLMANPGIKLEDIKYAKSHPQALAQCAGTLRHLNIQPINHYDTAGAARDLMANPDPHTAAIASSLAAKTYSMDILRHGVEDLPFNYTRMFILGLTDSPPQNPSKTSIIFTTRHTPGALYTVLGELAERGLNLTKIESRPRRNKAWHYRFLVDFTGHIDDPLVKEALLSILKCASSLKILGSYPAAPAWNIS